MSPTRAEKFADIPTEQRAPPRRADVGPEVFELHVLEGPDRPLVFRLGSTQERILVGQSPVCQLRLKDPSVSRRHAAVELDAGTLKWTDLQSTNGTVVNGLTVLELKLTGGERLRLGDTVIEIRRAPTGTRASSEPTTAASFGRVIGASPAMRALYPLCDRLAASQVPVIIEGETGTGKEVLAEAIHERSARAQGPFVVFDCTTVASSLVESALFGHERGAFTGATSARRGVFEEAEGGTLFIDELGELDLALQAKLLRGLERSEVRRIGGDRWIRVDVRVIAATRRDLDQAVQAGRFRDDLFFRIAVGRVELPPLRKRLSDIPLLAQHFWELHGGAGAVPADALERFATYSWPGNVRELYNAVARLLALGEALPGAPGLVEDTGLAPNPSGSSEGDLIERILARDLPLPTSRALLVEAFERRYVARVLERHAGNVARAAAASGIARRYFQLLKARQAR
jgi:transcriptional regulator with GAF, ATPase, and Fis domain